MIVPLSWGGNKWMCHQTCGSRRRISQYNFGTNIPSCSAGRCGSPFMFLLFGPCEENISMKEKRSRNVFQSQLFPPPQTFQSPGSFSVLRDPLECHLLFSNCKAFSPLPFLSLVGLLSSELAFFPFVSLPSSSSSSSSSCLTFVSLIRQIRGLGLGGTGTNSSGSTVLFSR